MRENMPYPLFLVAFVLCLPASLSLADEQADPKPTQELYELGDLLQAAVGQDGRVLAAHAQLDAYRARFKEAQWLWFPAAKLDVLFGAPVGERRLACPEDPACVKLRNPSPWSFGDLRVMSFAVGGRLEATLPLYTFGKLTSAKKAAEAGVEAARADIEQARRDVALEVRRAYYGWLLSVHVTEILADGEKKLKEAEQKLVKMLDALSEEVTDRDLFKLRYHSSQLQVLKAQTQQGQKSILSALQFLTGVEALGDTIHLKEIPLQVDTQQIQPAAEYLHTAQNNRPEIRKLQAALRALEASVEVGRAGFYPDLFIGGFLGGSYSPAHDHIKNPLLNKGLTYYDAGFSLGLRITLDIPQKVARLERSQAELSKLRIQFEHATRALELEIKKKADDLNLLETHLNIHKKGNRAAKAWMRANLMSYGIGISNTKDLLDSLAAYAQSQMGMYKLHHDLRVALDMLEASLGKDLTQTK